MTDTAGHEIIRAFDEPLGALANLVSAAAVRIHRPASGYDPHGLDTFLGSGFFVAPSWVLTCAHVAVRGEERTVNVVFAEPDGAGETAVAGTVAAALPEGPLRTGPAGGGRWSAPDLALVRLDRPAEHPCVYLAERPPTFFTGGKVLWAGWAEVEGQLQFVLSGRGHVLGSLGLPGGQGAQMRLGGDILTAGMSGGPVVDPLRGEVVGVIKSRAVGGSGGVAIGVEQLRGLPVPAGMVEDESDDMYQALCHAHDRYHRDRHRQLSPDDTWTDVQTRLDAGAGRALTPAQRVELLGRLARLPPPVSTPHLNRLLRRLPGLTMGSPSPMPRSWRDGLGVLHEKRGGAADLELVLRYCMSAIAAERPYVEAATANAQEELWAWVREIAIERLPRSTRGELQFMWSDILERASDGRSTASSDERPQRKPVDRTSVLLELEPRGWERDSYDWRVGVVHPHGDLDPLADGAGTALHEMPEQLAGPLAEAFRQCDEPGEPAVLEVALAQSVLGLDVEHWRLTSDGAPLGASRPVVVRCPDLMEHVEWPVDATRWDHVHGVGMRAVDLDCQDGERVMVRTEERLRSLAHETVPVLCHVDERPDAEATEGLLRMARSGFRVFLLRRSPLGSSPESLCGDLHRRAAVAVAESVTASQLPAKFHELRKEVWDNRTEAYWADRVALFYDDPSRPLPGPDLLLNAP